MRVVLTVALLATLLTGSPASAQPDSQWTLCVAGRGTPEQRISACDGVIASRRPATEVATALISRGRANVETGKTREAVKDYDEAIRLNPSDAAAFAGRGGVFVIQQRYDRAVRDYDEALRLGGGGDALTAIGRMLALQSKRTHDEALRCYDAAIHRNPQDAAALGARCHLKALADSPGPAREDCDRSLALRPNHAGTLDSRARVNLALGNVAQARSDWDAAIALTSAATRWSDAAIVPTATCSVAKSADFRTQSDGISLLAMLHVGRAFVREKQGDVAASNADLDQARRLVRSDAEWRVVRSMMGRWVPD